MGQRWGSDGSRPWHHVVASLCLDVVARAAVERLDVEDVWTVEAAGGSEEVHGWVEQAGVAIEKGICMYTWK